MKHAALRLAAALLGATVPVSAMIARAAVAEDVASGARLAPVEDGHALVARDGDVFIAAQPAPEDFDAWAARGVTTVVNLRSRAETAELGFDPAAEAAARGLSYSEIPMGGADGVSPDVVAQLADVLAGAEGPVVLHCRTGSRAAHAYAAYLVTEGEESRAALSEFGWPGGLSDETISALAP
jgi:uncharacterized protein (TIGR01244 family)